jgi:hypothetical protein
VSDTALKQLREELLCEVVVLTPRGHRQRIRNEWQKGREVQSAISEGKRRITVDEQDKETLEIIEGMIISDLCQQGQIFIFLKGGVEKFPLGCKQHH